ncbi:dehydrogenase [Haloferula helveola]|uniref:Dehydrogenase n=1 Tax=Haloferula helveola TaxID=490095 RepID=A0ABM7R7R7_9BACT|nr:dehydrogenase [Haloferula helveola]
MKPASLPAHLFAFLIPLLAHGGDLKLTETDDAILITLRDKPVLNYIKTEKPVPEGMDPHFRRSAYIHPVYAPTGQEVTGDFPADHPHQHALFLAWTKTKFDGKEIDFWNQAKELGRVEFREVLDVKREDRKVSFQVKHAFTVPEGEESIDVLHEIWTVTVYQTPEDHFLFDVESVQRCATDKPLHLPKYHYGGMAFRGNAEWLRDKGDPSLQPGDVRYLTREGKDRRDGNHTRTDWVSFTGEIGGQEVSATVFGSPENFRAPQHVRIHPDKPYFCFAPMVDGPFKISPGEDYTSRYRYLITSKALDQDVIEKHWNDYSKSE